MGYTDEMDTLASDIGADDEDYAERLREAVERFRCFDKFMDEFISEHGFDGGLDDIDGKTTFIRGKFKTANIGEPRGIREWFSEHKTIERGNAFRLAFAFGLNTSETAELFKRLCLGRCFDCHSVEEATYYFCMQNGLSYSDAVEIIEKVPKNTVGKIPDDENILYTGNIISELEKLNSKDDLIEYLTRNAVRLVYNNVSATKCIQEIWREISDPNRSVWENYLRILGLDDVGKSIVSELKIDRSLKPIFKDNKLLHPLAAALFPDREGINRVLNGEHVSYERIRKLLILLLFYRFWEKKFAERKNYRAEFGDSERCIADIDRYLIDVNYPELYCGDPYDWIFIQAIRGDSPMEEFWFFIGELFAEKSEEEIHS
ncbi:MAG: hypothetical protein NC401_17510 [Ruminococcus sp.]|nr:hypothetical protein [Ruminococcus sp.]